MVSVISAGADHTLFVRSDGSLWGTGENASSQIGGGPAEIHFPQEIVSSGCTAIAGGNAHTLFLESDGSLWVMGNNDYGQVGNGTTNGHRMPQQIVSSNVTAVAAGWTHSLFIKSDGSLWGMGDNGNGELGDNTSAFTYQKEKRQSLEKFLSEFTTTNAAGWTSWDVVVEKMGREFKPLHIAFMEVQKVAEAYEAAFLTRSSRCRQSRM